MLAALASAAWLEGLRLCWGERTTPVSYLPPSQARGWCPWMVVEGQICWKERNFCGTLERARAETVCVGQ